MARVESPTEAGYIQQVGNTASDSRWKQGLVGLHQTETTQSRHTDSLPILSMSSQDNTSQTSSDEPSHSTETTTAEPSPTSTQSSQTDYPTTRVKNALPKLSEDFLHTDPPETFAADMSDDETVTACLTSAADYFHAQLPEAQQTWITDKWGLTPDTIEQKKIGYVDSSNQVITHLRDEGYSPVTLIRASLGTESTLNHLFNCDGVSQSNTNLVPDEHQDAEIDSHCPHHPDTRMELLVRAMQQGVVEEAEIDLESVVEYLDSEDELNIWCWWDNRLTFPYRNGETGEIQYFIARATDKTDDQIYNNGITDRSEMPCLPLSETTLAKRYQGQADWASHADEYLVLPQSEGPYKSPHEHDETVETITTAIEQMTNPDGSRDSDTLIDHGLEYAPSWREELDTGETTRIHLFAEEMLPDTYETDYVLTPPAVGVNPGMSVKIANHTEHTIDTQWEDTVSPDGPTREFPDTGVYKLSLTVDDEEHRLIVDVSHSVDTQTRNTEVENWVGEESTFDVDLAKYIKQTVSRPWINENSVTEPIFGAETVHEDRPLIVTEGITDAIATHQYNLPCVTPATTNFKRDQYERICEIASEASAIHVINDNEASGAGIEGALRSARMIEEVGQDVHVAELPRPDGHRKIDVAEFLKTRMQNPETDPRAELIDVIKDGVPPQEHPQYGSEHDPYNKERTDNSDYSTLSSEESDSSTEYTGGGHGDRSAIYDMHISDVIGTVTNGSTRYRGTHPLGHYGDSESYFVIRGTGTQMVVLDYKATTGNCYSYNALTWLATAATCDCAAGAGCSCTRSPRHPSGSLRFSEVWWAWHHAKTASHIDMPDDDKVPSKAMWYLANHHDLLPAKFIPNGFDEEKKLPAATYNTIIELIETEYGLNAGREPLAE